MKIVSVRYTTRPEYASANQANILGIVQELKNLNHSGIHYGPYLLADGKTFLHLDHFENEEAHQVLMSLASFKKFQSELLASKLEVDPTLDLLSEIG